MALDGYGLRDLACRSSGHVCLVSGFCSSNRDFAPRFLQTGTLAVPPLRLHPCFTSIRLHRGLSPPGRWACPAHVRRLRRPAARLRDLTATPWSSVRQQYLRCRCLSDAWSCRRRDQSGLGFVGRRVEFRHRLDLHVGSEGPPARSCTVRNESTGRISSDFDLTRQVLFRYRMGPQLLLEQILQSEVSRTRRQRRPIAPHAVRTIHLTACAASSIERRSETG